MRNIKRLFVMFILITGIAIFTPNQVKADTAYDLNGNPVEVDILTKITHEDYIEIWSPETGTTAYVDKSTGELIKLINDDTGEVIINNEVTTVAPELTTKVAEVTTTAAKEKITMKKITKLKKQTSYKYYKGVKSIKKNGEPNWGKIKYKYGIKLKWKSVKGAKGYEIYRYENAAKRWTKIKTTKKTKYILTNMLEGEKVKIKIRAYKNTKNGKEYGKFSNVLKFTTKQVYTKIYKNARYKNFYSKWASEDAFVIQNKYRKAAGVKELKWSDVIYNICIARVKELDEQEDFSHDNFRNTLKSVLISKYNIQKEKAINISMRSGENLALNDTATNAMKSWRKSSEHYKNIIHSTYASGGIATDGYHWVSVFSSFDVDREIENK